MDIGRLVLQRKIKQAIFIGDGVRVTVVAVEGTKVKLGIDAPKSVPIRRAETVDRGEQQPRT